MRQTNYELLLWPVDDPSEAIRLEHASISYKVNDIPQAMVRLAHGYSVRSGQPAKVPDAWREPTTKLRIGYKATTTRAYDGKPVTRSKILFEGYPRTPSAELAANSGDLTLLLQHWLSDLAGSVIRSQFSYPGHIGQKYYDAITYPDSLAGNQVTPEGIAKGISLPGNWKQLILEDVWASGGKQIIASLLTNPVMANLAEDAFCIQALNVPTKAAAAALQRIQGPSEKLGSPYERGGQALSVYKGLDGRAHSAVATGIRNITGYRPVSAFQSASAWDMIQDFASALALYLIPRPTDAFLAPAVPGLDRYYATRILEHEIRQLSWADTRNVNLRGVAIAAQLQDLSGVGALMQSGQQASRVHAGGCYIVSDDPDEGLVAFIRPPVWLASAQINTPPASASLSGGDTSGTHNPPEPPDAGDSPISIQDYFNLYAKQRYIEEQLRGRSLQVVTPFRTDIAPGSSIAVAIRNQYSQTRLGLETTSLVGLVREMTLTLSRVSGDASTSYVLDFVRTIEDLADEKLSLSKHPVFDNTFLGAELA